MARRMRDDIDSRRVCQRTRPIKRGKKRLLDGATRRVATHIAQPSDRSIDINVSFSLSLSLSACVINPFVAIFRD